MATQTALTRERRRFPVPAPAAAGLVFAAAPLTWWAIGPLGTDWDHHDVGPFRVAPALLYAVGATAAIAAVASITAVAVTARRGARKSRAAIDASALWLTMVAFSSIAAGWRVATAGSSGANNGGGMAQLGGPVLVAMLFVAAVVVQARHRPMRRVQVAVLATVAVLTAPMLWRAESAVYAYDQSRGRISRATYDSVVLGSTRTQVRDRLGTQGEKTDWFFGPAPEGAVCDYYDRSEPGPESLVFRFCYRGTRLIKKESSTAPR